MKRVIISGATGTIGTALIKNLIENKIEVLVLCRRESSRNIGIPDHPLIEKKFCSLNEFCNLENETNKVFDIFYHFAWIGTTGCERTNSRLQILNLQYTLDAVDLAKRFGCHTFIGAGSQAEFGRFEGVLKSTTSCTPENSYGIAKLCAGHLSKEYAHQIGLKHIWTRIVSIYGPNDGAQTMVMSTINKLKNGEVAQFTKGEQMWDYLYSEDAAEAFRLLGEKGKDGKVYVLGKGEAYPLKDYIEIISELLDAQNLIELGAIPYSKKQVMHLCADISELKADTGWQPKVSFKEGILKILNQDR